MSLSLNPGVLVAAFELKAVTSITSAVRANLIAAGGVPGPLGTVQMPKPGGGGGFGPAVVNSISPEPRIEGRWVHRPEPRIEGRWVHRPEPKIEPRELVHVGHEPAKPGGLEKVWDMPIEPKPVAKPEPVADKAPRELSAGSLLDTFA